MIAIIVLAFLCLAAVSLILRVALFFRGKNDHPRLGVFFFMLAYWIAPQFVMSTLR
jgi:hypothetical protein